MDFTQIQADTENHAIAGYVPTAGRSVHIPLISHIVDNLYVGGCVDGVDLGDFFSHVFSMYKWEAYKVSPETQVHTVTMYDDPSRPVDVETVADVARKVQQALDEGGNVLVHCQAGINRSNLVAATVLINQGRSAEEAIELLRQRRNSIVLANQAFYDHLLSL